MFSGRGIIPLEAASVGAIAVGVDLSPVATLGGRLLADYPFRDWSGEPPLPFKEVARRRIRPRAATRSAKEPRLLNDVRLVLAEVGQTAGRGRTSRTTRVTQMAGSLGHTCGRSPSPATAASAASRSSGPWCCAHPYRRTQDPGQALRLLKTR